MKSKEQQTRPLDESYAETQTETSSKVDKKV